MSDQRREWHVYALRDPRSNAIRYVGITTNLQKRYSSHLKAKDATPRGIWIRELLAANLAPIVEVLETGEDADCQTAERRWIAALRKTGCDLTNTTDGGNGTAGYEWTPEARAKLGAAVRGTKHTPERKAKSAAAHRALNRKLSDEHKAIVSRTHKGVSFMSPEGRQRVGEWARNRRVPAETREKISKALKGREFSEETRAQIRATLTGKKLPEATCNKMREAWAKRKAERSSFPEMRRNKPVSRQPPP